MILLRGALLSKNCSLGAQRKFREMLPVVISGMVSYFEGLGSLTKVSDPAGCCFQYSVPRI